MLIHKIFNVSEARAKLFEIFNLVSEGKNIVIVNTDTNKKFQIIPLEEKPKKDIDKLLKQASRIGFKSMPVKEMKKILESRLDPC